MVEALKPEVEMTRAKILKRKKDLSDLQIFLFYFKRVDSLPRSAKGGFQGCGENPNSPHVILPSRRKPTSGKRSEPRRAGGALQSKDLGSFLTPKKDNIMQ